jgi:hypothetical protein
MVRLADGEQEVGLGLAAWREGSMDMSIALTHVNYILILSQRLFCASRAIPGVVQNMLCGHVWEMLF